MPQWMIDFWAIYGEQIVPALVTLTIAMLGYLTVKLRANTKNTAEVNYAQLDTLKKLAAREDVKSELQAMYSELGANRTEMISIKKNIGELSDQFNEAFQNSTLNPEVKDRLSLLTNKIKYGTDNLALKTLQEENIKKDNIIKELSQQLQVPKVDEVVPKETIKKIRR